MINNTCKVRGDSIAGFLLAMIFIFAVFFVSPVFGEVFFGAKIGLMKVDVPASTDPTNIAVSLGYEFDSLLADLSLVGEISHSMRSGEMSNGDELQFKSEAMYLVWKTTRSQFVTLRSGVVQTEIREGYDSRSGVGLLLGGSVGMVIGRTRLQIEYTSLAGDANFLGIGLEF